MPATDLPQIRRLLPAILMTLAAGAVPPGAAAAGQALRPVELGVIVNTDDPWSEEIARYYIGRRGVPPDNLVRISLGDGVAVSRATFEQQKVLVERKLAPEIRALALAFRHPLKVDVYNSITSAFSHGYYERPAGASSADFGYANPYPRTPMRISMMLTGASLPHVKALIDRGIAADGTHPQGEFLCMATSDRLRSQRCSGARPGPALKLVHADTVTGANVLGYFQGMAVIPQFSAEYPPDNVEFPRGNRFLPGAWADNLTSAGAIEDGGQTTVWQILAAGATGSYGMVEEPYALTGKFPDPTEFTNSYRNGDTLIEAAWKSVGYPYQGLFVGEPLASPWQQPR